MHKSRSHADVVDSEMQKTRKRVAAQMKNQAFNGKDPITIVNYLIDFKRACHLSNIQEGAAVWLFRDYTTDPAFAAIKARLTIS